MPGFEVVSIEPVTMSRANRLTNMYVLSPFVWEADGGCHLMIRAVPRRDDDPRLKMAEVWYGHSEDGRHFDMDKAPAIFPGPEMADLDGCEDPTVHCHDGVVRVWYTGWNQREETGRLMLARGPDVRRLAKAGVAVDARPPAFCNTKEATIANGGPLGWRMFFEFARDGASLIGRADTDELDGPWSEPADTMLSPRPNQWDAWHVSAGPIIGDGGGQPVMFYNGATRDAKWRIGWAVFDAGLNEVVARCDEPLISPGELLGETDTDIAFVASAVETDAGILLYYSLSDQHLRRALIRRT